jgi:hypothetical protein
VRAGDDAVRDLVDRMLRMVEEANTLTGEAIEQHRETLHYYHRWLIGAMLAWAPILLIGYWIGAARG